MEVLGIKKKITCYRLLQETVKENRKLEEENHELRKCSIISPRSSKLPHLQHG